LLSSRTISSEKTLKFPTVTCPPATLDLSLKSLIKLLLILNAGKLSIKIIEIINKALIFQFHQVTGTFSLGKRVYFDFSEYR